MSTKAGQNHRTRPQKHQNNTVWKVDLHKSDPKTKLLQSLTVINCCQHCTGVLEWKIKYGKYKPLSKPVKCIKCGERKVKYAYHVLCQDCVSASGYCAKCNKPQEIVNTPEPSVAEAAKIENELQIELKALSERKRRTFLRYLSSREEGPKTTSEETEDSKEAVQLEANYIKDQKQSAISIKKEALEKLRELRDKFSLEDDFNDLDFGDSEEESQDF